MAKKRADSPPPPLCVWCGAPWTDDMLKAYAYADCSCGEYGSIESVEITIDVTCSSCNRLVYRKEVKQVGNHWG